MSEASGSLNSVRDKMAMTQRQEEAVQASQTVATQSPAPCPIDVDKLCRQTEQDDFEKANNIAPGCGYYRRKHNDFLQRNPGGTPPSYYLDYGEYYCNRFTRETNAKLTPNGQRWLREAKCNLQNSIERELSRYPSLENSDKRFTAMAFGTHSKAYLEAGLGTLDPDELLQVLKTPDGKEWLKGETWGQAWDVLPDTLPRSGRIFDKDYLERIYRDREPDTWNF